MRGSGITSPSTCEIRISRNHEQFPKALPICGLLTACAIFPARAQSLYTFPATADDGIYPYSGVVMDQTGALLGATSGGGSNANLDGGGIVFRLTPTLGGGRWTEQRLHEFPDGANDGYTPVGDLLMDTTGALYGVTANGGTSPAGPSKAPRGTVYKLTPPATPGGQWVEAILHTFSAMDGASPEGGLISDATGALYGVTFDGGAFMQGVVYRLSPPVPGSTQWTEEVLHDFNPGTMDGRHPQGRLAMDGDGNVYGTTEYGGPSSHGSVFELSPPASGTGPWIETIVYDFPTIYGGSSPIAGVIIASDGILYGSTFIGGHAGDSTCSLGCGVVFSLSPPAVTSSPWTYTILHNFSSVPDGQGPVASLTLDASGNLFGTTNLGGMASLDCGGPPYSLGCGTVFSLARPTGGKRIWHERLRASLGYASGAEPIEDLFLGVDGYAYGVTPYGGTLPHGSIGQGTVFRVKAVP